MDKINLCFGLFCIGIIIGIFLVLFIDLIPLEKQAIEKGYAEYNSTNGKWQWKENK